MIKRMKWNVVYDDDGGDASSGEEEGGRRLRGSGLAAASYEESDASSSDLEGRDEDVMINLMKNEMDTFGVQTVVKEAEQSSSSSSSSDEDEGPKVVDVSPEAVIQVLRTERLKETGTKVCTLCKFRQLINDKDIEKHLGSRMHRNNIKRALEHKDMDDRDPKPKAATSTKKIKVTDAKSRKKERNRLRRLEMENAAFELKPSIKAVATPPKKVRKRKSMGDSKHTPQGEKADGHAEAVKKKTSKAKEDDGRGLELSKAQLMSAEKRRNREEQKEEKDHERGRVTRSKSTEKIIVKKQNKETTKDEGETKRQFVFKRENRRKEVVAKRSTRAKGGGAIIEKIRRKRDSIAHEEIKDATTYVEDVVSEKAERQRGLKEKKKMETIPKEKGSHHKDDVSRQKERKPSTRTADNTGKRVKRRKKGENGATKRSVDAPTEEEQVRMKKREEQQAHGAVTVERKAVHLSKSRNKIADEVSTEGGKRKVVGGGKEKSNKLKKKRETTRKEQGHK